MSIILRNSILGKLAVTATLGLFAGVSVPARASFIINMYNDGSGNVVATGSGTIDTADLTPGTGTTARAIAYPSASTIGVGGIVGSVVPINSFRNITIPSSGMGIGGVLFPTSATGDIVAIDDEGASTLYVPRGYVSGSLLSGTATWAGQSIDGMGLIPGTYEWTWGSGADADSFTLSVSEAEPTPEPASASMLLLGAGALGFAALQRRKTQMQGI